MTLRAIPPSAFTPPRTTVQIHFDGFDADPRKANLARAYAKAGIKPSKKKRVWS